MASDNGQVVLSGLADMRRKGLGWVAGYKPMMVTVYATGEVLLAEANNPDIPSFRLQFGADGAAEHRSEGEGLEQLLTLRAKGADGNWEEHVLRVPRDDRNLPIGPAMRKWVNAIEQTKLVKPKKKKLKLLKKKKPTTESKPPQPPSARDDVLPSAETLYTAIDKNEDGRLSKSEIKKYLKAQPWAQAYITADHFTWKALWDKFDADGDGRLDEDEFGRWYTEELVPVLRTAIAEGKLEAREVDAPVKAAEASVGEGNEAETVGAETVGEDPDVAAEVPTPKGTAHEAASEATPEATDGAATQPHDDVPSAETLYTAIDKNEDGRLSKSEIKKYLKAQPWAQAYITADHFTWKALWDKFDADGDGRLDEDEFGRWYTEELVPVLRTAIAEGKLEAREVDAPVKAAEASVGEGNEAETVGAETVGEDPDVAAEVPTPKGTAHEAASEATPEATDGAATQPPNDPARGDQSFDDMSLCRRILTIGEAQQVEEAFERMDKDGNGLITFDEFTRALLADNDLCRLMSKGVLTARGKPYLDAKDRAKLWSLMDEDLDTTISVPSNSYHTHAAFYKNVSFDSLSIRQVSEFRAVWRMVPLLSHDEHHRAERCFSRIDVQGNDEVSFHNFCDVLRDDQELCQLLTRGILTRKGTATLSVADEETLWQRINKQPDGCLSRDEFNSIWHTSPKLTPPEALDVEAAFQRMDTDGKGEVSHAAFHQILQSDSVLCKLLSRGILSRDGKPYLNLKDRARLWQLLDRDLDQNLTHDEFVAIWGVGNAPSHSISDKEITHEEATTSTPEQESSTQSETEAVVVAKKANENQQLELKLKARAVYRRKEMAAIYPAFDKQGNGVTDEEISLEEFVSIGSALHHGEWTEEQNLVLHRAMDRDRDDPVQLDEFLHFYRTVIHDIDDAQFEQGITAFRTAVDRHEAVAQAVKDKEAEAAEAAARADAEKAERAQKEQAAAEASEAALAEQNPVVLSGLADMRRKGLGYLAGYKEMMVTVYTTGELILAEADTPLVPSFRVRFGDLERSDYITEGTGTEMYLTLKARMTPTDEWEEHVLRVPRDEMNVPKGPSMASWIDAIQRARLSARKLKVPQMQAAAETIFLKAWHRARENHELGQITDFDVVFETEGPLGIFIGETEAGAVVITGPNGGPLQVNGVAVVKGLRFRDQVMAVNNEPVKKGERYEEVKARVAAASRPLRLSMRRRSDVPVEPKKSELGKLTKRQIRDYLTAERAGKHGLTPESDQRMKKTLGVSSAGWERFWNEFGYVKDMDIELSLEEFTHIYVARVQDNLEQPMSSSASPKTHSGATSATTMETQEKVGQLEAQLKDKENVIQEMQTQLSEVVAAHVLEREKERKKYVAEKDIIEQTCRTLSAENATLQADLKRRDDRIAGLEDSYTANHEASIASVSKSAEAAAKAAEQEDLIDRLESEVESLRSQLATHAAANIKLEDQNTKLKEEVAAFAASVVPSDPVVLEGLLELRRSGLGVMAGYKLMLARLYHSGDFVLSKAKNPNVHKARVRFGDKELAAMAVVPGTVQESLLVQNRDTVETDWEKYVLRQPAGIASAPSVQNWVDAIHKTCIMARRQHVPKLKQAASALFQKAFHRVRVSCPPHEFKVLFEEPGPLGIFIADTTGGFVVINGPEKNGGELDPNDMAAKRGLRNRDAIMAVNGTPTIGCSADQVKSLVISAGRPLELTMHRRVLDDVKVEDVHLLRSEIHSYLESDRSQQGLHNMIGISSSGWDRLSAEMKAHSGQERMNEAEFVKLYLQVIGDVEDFSSGLDKAEFEIDEEQPPDELPSSPEPLSPSPVPLNSSLVAMKSSDEKDAEISRLKDALAAKDASEADVGVMQSILDHARSDYENQLASKIEMHSIQLSEFAAEMQQAIAEKDARIKQLEDDNAGLSTLLQLGDPLSGPKQGGLTIEQARQLQARKEADSPQLQAAVAALTGSVEASTVGQGVAELEAMLAKANAELDHMVSLSEGYKSMRRSSRERSVAARTRLLSLSPSPARR